MPGGAGRRGGPRFPGPPERIPARSPGWGRRPWPPARRGFGVCGQRCDNLPRGKAAPGSTWRDQAPAGTCAPRLQLRDLARDPTPRGFLGCQHPPAPPGGPARAQTAGPGPRVSGAAWRAWASRIGISSKFPSNTDAAAQRSHSEQRPARTALPSAWRTRLQNAPEHMRGLLREHVSRCLQP